MPKSVRFLLLALLANTSPTWAVTPFPQPAWQDWSPQVFAQARAEKKLVLLDMAAVWCHWCHVMDEKTYADPAVLAELKQHYRVIRVDQDARPDLSNRYKDYGWPATILFDAQGRELVKRAGYIERSEFLPLLQATYKRPKPEVEAKIPKHRIGSSSQLTPELRNTLLRKHRNSIDTSLGGLRIAMKFLDRDSVEYSLALAAAGDASQRSAAMQTLDAALKLKDPVWGGFYQYSTHGDWQHPHFEKLLAVQAGYLRIYAQAFAQLEKPQYADAARSTVAYLQRFLSSPEGAIYASQDADLVPGQHSEAYFASTDAERRRLGIPRVDKHLYAREAGLAAEALADDLRVKHPLVASDSVDVVVSNCVLNLVDPQHKRRLFEEIFRVLKNGGRAVISDIVSDEEIPMDLQKDPVLWSGCISGAFTEDGFLQAFQEAGFYGIEILKRDAAPWQTVEGIEVRSVTVQAWKGKQGPCFERNQAVIYKGPFLKVLDDDGHAMERGKRYAVCGKTFQLYNKAPYQNFFEFIGPRLEVPGDTTVPFDCTTTRLRHPKETKGHDYHVTTAASNCGDRGAGADCC